MPLEPIGMPAETVASCTLPTQLCHQVVAVGGAISPCIERDRGRNPSTPWLWTDLSAPGQLVIPRAEEYRSRTARHRGTRDSSRAPSVRSENLPQKGVRPFFGTIRPIAVISAAPAATAAVSQTVRTS